MLPVQPRKSDQGFNLWHAMTHSFRAPGSPRFTFGFGAMAVIGVFLVFFIFSLLSLIFASRIVSMMIEGDFNNFGRANIGILILFYILFLLIMILFNAVVESGMHRRMLGQQAGGFPFRLGRDEKNVFLALLGSYSLIVCVYFLGAFLLSLLLGAIKQSVTTIPIIAGGIFAACMFVLAVKLSPAAALSVLNKKPHVLAAFKVSKHRTLPLIFTWLLIMVFLCAALTLIGLVTLGPSDLMKIFSGNSVYVTGSPANAFSLLTLGFSILWYPIWMGIGSYIVKHWAGGDLHQASVFE